MLGDDAQVAIAAATRIRRMPVTIGWRAIHENSKSGRLGKSGSVGVMPKVTAQRRSRLAATKSKRVSAMRLAVSVG